MDNKDRVEISDLFDGAALATAALAGALNIIAAPGPYDWMNGVTGITILVILFAYEFDRPRKDPRKSLAFSAVTAFVMLLVVGLVYELIASNGTLGGKPTEWGKETQTDSKIIAMIWLGLVFLFYQYDRYRQRKKSS